MVVLADLELFERDGELDELRECLEGARGGVGRLVVVEGEAGIGKTALVRSACTDAKDLGMQVLTARGTELERDFPFALVRQLFEPVLVAAGPEQRAELLAGAARLAGRVVGLDQDADAASGSAPLVDPSAATLNALFWLTSNLSETRPALLAVDDAHWADPASLRFLEFLLPRLEDLPVLLLVAARPAEPGVELDALARLTTDAVATVIRPRALSEAAVVALVRAALSPEADDVLCAACHEVTRGNPFMLRELLVELRAEGSRGAAGDVPLVREMAPSSLGRAVLLRLARLPDPARRLARSVAVLGEDCDLLQAAALAEIDPDAAAGAADALAAAGILEAGPRVGFVHPLVRNAIHADLPPSERATAHGHAARLLEQAGAEPERVALHVLATAPADDPEVVQTLATAAQRALDRAAPEAAARYLQRALAESAAPPARPAILRMLITAAMRLGDSAVVEAVGGDPLAELSADPQTLTESAWELTMGMMATGRAEEVGPLVEQAVEVARERGDLDLALRLEGLLVSANRLSPAQARERFARHADAVVPDSAGERLWLALQSWWGTFLGEPAAELAEQARRALADGRIFAEQPDAPPPSQAILVLTITEQLDLAADRIEAFRADAAARGSAGGLAQVAHLRGRVEILRGEIARAEAEARSAFEVAHRGGFLAAVPVFAAVHLEALIERGELEEADRELADLGLTGSLPEDYWWAAVLRSRALLRLAQHRFEDAVADLLQFEGQDERAGTTTPFYSIGSQLALALAAVGRPDEAQRSAERELDRARAWGTPSAVGTALRVLGVLETGEQGLQLLEEAVAVIAPSPVRLEYARALTDYGAALRRANRRADARGPLREALDIARRGGALAIATRARDELEATGEKQRPLLATGVESLTPSERRVAELAAEGLRNREIAQTLFLTIKTVEMHLSRAYRKLDISSRRELRERLEHQGAVKGLPPSP